MISTSEPARSSQFAEPMTLPSAPEQADDCSRSSALPLAKFSLAGMSNSTTSPSCLARHRFASSPPMLPAPMSPIFFLAMVFLRHQTWEKPGVDQHPGARNCPATGTDGRAEFGSVGPYGARAQRMPTLYQTLV